MAKKKKSKKKEDKPVEIVEPAPVRLTPAEHGHLLFAARNLRTALSQVERVKSHTQDTTYVASLIADAGLALETRFGIDPFTHGEKNE